MKSIDQIKQLVIPILKFYNINKAGLFGSYVRLENNEKSDIDILVEFKESISLLDFVRVKFALENELQKKVDLVEYKTIKPRLIEHILSEEIRIYG